MIVIKIHNYLVLCDIAIAGSEQEISMLLPIMPLDTQREKAAVSKDIEEMLKKEFEKNIGITAVEVVNILFGISIGDLKNPYYR
jgi:hypothetical protein